MPTATFTAFGRDLPRPWAEKAHVAPDAEVKITIETPESPDDVLERELEHSLAQADRGETVGPFDTHEDLVAFLNKSRGDES